MGISVHTAETETAKTPYYVNLLAGQQLVCGQQTISRDPKCSTIWLVAIRNGGGATGPVQD